jgi:hypothetical protein
LQAAALAHHQSQQQLQQEQQDKQQHPHTDSHQQSIVLPPSASPFHTASTGRVPAIRKWGTQNRGAGTGTGSNKVSPMAVDWPNGTSQGPPPNP